MFCSTWPRARLFGLLLKKLTKNHLWVLSKGMKQMFLKISLVAAWRMDCKKSKVELGAQVSTPDMDPSEG